MAHRLALGAIGLVASCAFDLDTVPRPPADAHFADTLSPDASVDGPTDASCPTTTFSASAEGDTLLSSALPTVNYGTNPVAEISAIAGTVGLFRFDVTTLPPTARIQSASVTFTFAATSTSCSPSCGDCACFERAGALVLFAMRSDWDESIANWADRTTNQPWSSAGASQGGIDRSVNPLASINHLPGRTERFDVDSSALASLNETWRKSDKLSFQLVPASGAAMIVATRES